MRKSSLIFIALLLLVLGSLKAQVYDKKRGRGQTRPAASSEDNDYLDRQAKVFLDTVNVLLNQFPPAPFSEARERADGQTAVGCYFA
ncbi:MAG: hypothetical protein U5K79_08535 [Cyclobacteriaceae bacterium]|nr:hypothetical protein [Cyclobacteriaceae bacterium]